MTSIASIVSRADTCLVYVLNLWLCENSVAFREDQDAKKVDKRRSTGAPAPRKRKSGAKVANGETANGEYDDEPAMDTS